MNEVQRTMLGVPEYMLVHVVHDIVYQYKTSCISMY